MLKTSCSVTDKCCWWVKRIEMYLSKSISGFSNIEANTFGNKVIFYVTLTNLISLENVMWIIMITKITTHVQWLTEISFLQYMSGTEMPVQTTALIQHLCVRNWTRSLPKCQKSMREILYSIEIFNYLLECIYMQR